MNVELFMLGGILFVLGLVAGDFQAKVFLIGIGLVFMAAGARTSRIQKEKIYK